jgi:hypothetical protein
VQRLKFLRNIGEKREGREVGGMWEFGGYWEVGEYVIDIIRFIFILLLYYKLKKYRISIIF